MDRSVSEAPPGPAVSRRVFLTGSTLVLAGLNERRVLAAEERASALRVGLLTDIHAADKPAAGNRYYREAIGKLREAVHHFNESAPAFVVELGDLIDRAESVEQELIWLAAAEREYARVQAERHYVLGNHCVDTLTKAEFAAQTGAARTPHYSFEKGGMHFVVLDACFREDGEPYGRKNFEWFDASIPFEQLQWLRADLKETALPAVVFAHQRLDRAGQHAVKNAAAVREVLEASGRVLAVFQGHSHQNAYQQIAGIHYCTLAAMIEGSGPENSGYALLSVMEDGSMRLDGFRKQLTRVFKHPDRRA